MAKPEPQQPPPPHNPDDVLRRMLNTPPKPKAHKPRLKRLGHAEPGLPPSVWRMPHRPSRPENAFGWCCEAARSKSTQEDDMPKVAPFHSVKENTRNVYHDNSKCTEGNNIEKQYLRQGTDNRPRCQHCNELAQKGQ